MQSWLYIPTQKFQPITVVFLFKQNQDQRTLDIDTAVTMIHLLLHGSWSLLNDFIEFLQVGYNLVKEYYSTWHARVM